MQFVLKSLTEITDLYNNDYYRLSVRKGRYNRFRAENYGIIAFHDTPQLVLASLNSQLRDQDHRFRDGDLEGMRSLLRLNNQPFDEVDDGKREVSLVANVSPASQILLDRDDFEPVEPWVDPVSITGTREWFIAVIRSLNEAKREGTINQEFYRTTLLGAHAEYVAYQAAN